MSDVQPDTACASRDSFENTINQVDRERTLKGTQLLQILSSSHLLTIDSADCYKTDQSFQLEDSLPLQ